MTPEEQYRWDKHYRAFERTVTDTPSWFDRQLVGMVQVGIIPRTPEDEYNVVSALRACPQPMRF
jgi:hypothetical protein